MEGSGGREVEKEVHVQVRGKRDEGLRIFKPIQNEIKQKARRGEGEEGRGGRRRGCGEWGREEREGGSRRVIQNSV